MASNAALQNEPAPIRACTVARDVQNFDLLIEDMETELGEDWGDLGFTDAIAFLEQPEASELEFFAIAINSSDESNLTQIGELIQKAGENDVKVVLIAEDVSPIALHQLLRFGADDFVPYPLPEGALHDSIEKLRTPPPVVEVPVDPAAPQTGGQGTKNAVIFPVHGLAGGVGSSTIAVNLAWELCNVKAEEAPKVCLIDLDLQFGSAATFLDLARRENVFEFLSDIENQDDDAFRSTLLTFNDKLSVFTAPADILPLDIVSPEDIERMIDMAQRNFDYVVIDMPSTIVQWTEVVLSKCDVYFGVLELDLRSAQNTLRMIRALKSEDLPHEKIKYLLNRAPKFTDMGGKSRAKRMAESLDIDIEVYLPDGGKPVPQSCDHGLPLKETAAKNPLRKELVKLTQSLHEVNQAAETA